ncbi:hypothetical protein [Desulforhabdus amnigena]|uniref:hypothetical protein n=1 Tax=Desulforhabdus amnigena TaxID=40218 RepID=UPI0016BB0B00|nr:hypothetical protein [Desulforhabdus amnigena]NLJ27053.1 hypothetical protein [Deltaproteobacteria bacterium]
MDCSFPVRCGSRQVVDHGKQEGWAAESSRRLSFISVGWAAGFWIGRRRLPAEALNL